MQPVQKTCLTSFSNSIFRMNEFWLLVYIIYVVPKPYKI